MAFFIVLIDVIETDREVVTNYDLVDDFIKGPIQEGHRDSEITIITLTAIFVTLVEITYRVVEERHNFLFYKSEDLKD